LLYRFEEGNPVGICKFKEAVIAFYDMDQLNGDCFDESRISDVNIPLEQILAYVETEEDIEKLDRSRVFVYMEDDKKYELVMNPINTSCSNFYDIGNIKFEKQYTESTLMNMKKSNLVNYIQCLVHNNNVLHERINRQAEFARNNTNFKDEIIEILYNANLSDNKRITKIQKLVGVYNEEVGD
jgi:hypothetical protein